MSDIGIANKLRKICLALEDVVEAETFGHPTFRVGGKTFCVLDEHKGESAIAVKVGLPVQGVFLKDPRFYKTPYTGQHGWVSLKTKTTLNWREIEELVRGSYKLMARRSTAADRSVKRRQ
jgi:predicted DNA-binding protein (MmcQ/YjbR family)